MKLDEQIARETRALLDEALPSLTHLVVAADYYLKAEDDLKQFGCEKWDEHYDAAVAASKRICAYLVPASD